MEEIREKYEGLCGRLVEAGVYHSLEEVENLFDTLIKSGIYGSPEEAVKGANTIVEIAEGLKVAEESPLRGTPNYDALRTLVNGGVYDSMEEDKGADGWFRAVKDSGIELC